MRTHFLAPILPRLSLIVFRYSQPVLIRSAVRYLGSEAHQASFNAGSSVMMMAVVVYVGLAVGSPLLTAYACELTQGQKLSKVVYIHRIDRLRTIIRGAVVGLINRKSLEQHFSSYDDAKAVTLMSTDTENVCQSARFFHETWAQVIEVMIGTAMLAMEVGWIAPVPLIIIFCKWRNLMLTTRRMITHFAHSLLQNESVSCQESPEQAESLERSYTGAFSFNDFYAGFDEEPEDVRCLVLRGIPDPVFATSGAGHGQTGPVDDGRLQCKR